MGDHVMIGCHACILGGIQIGNNAKIGAGAVVIRDVRPGGTVVGPAAN
ncbi:DapH/DapD/GlmU-related protein [Roseimaritima multifibrata]